MSNFRQLLVWQKAHDLSLRVDQLAKVLKRRKPSLAKQIERAADSVTANIAEGRGRETDADFAHFVSIAIGSVTEVEHHLQRAYDGELIAHADYADLTASCIRIRRMLIGLRRTLRGQPRREGAAAQMHVEELPLLGAASRGEGMDRPPEPGPGPTAQSPSPRP
ncbi:MAG: four helix bundle protein [Gemmatimonadota bacterium]|nr:four helix bundle protein [Gemmatimonadota bacterium]